MSKLSFTLPVYRDLKTRLGYYDSITELNELAIRELIKAAGNDDTPGQYIQNLSKEHGIHVNFSEFSKELSAIMSQSYIVTIYQSADLFLREYQREHCFIHGVTWSYEEVKKGGTRLEQAFRNTEKNYDILNTLDYKIYDYYRLVRNFVVHPNIKDKETIKLLQNELILEKSFINEKYKVESAPSKIDEICFEDFVLFTKVVKELARILCELAKPSSKKIIVSLNINKFSKIRNNHNRFVKAISNKLRIEYDLNEHEIAEILEEVDLTEML